jgi:hypothetical protein
VNGPSGGMKERVPGFLVQRERRTQRWKEGVEIAEGVDNASVTSGVWDNREVQSIVPVRMVDILFPFLPVRRTVEGDIRGEGHLKILRYINEKFLRTMSNICSPPRNGR